MNGFIEKNHNRHLDMLQEYKKNLIEQVRALEKLDRESDFIKEWNRTTIIERKAEIKTIDTILKNLVRF